MHRRRYYQRYSLERFLSSLVIFFIGYQIIVYFVKQQTGITITQPNIHPLLLVLIIWAIMGLIIYRIYQYYRLTKAGIKEIDMMSGEEFEKRLVILFSQLGYDVKHIGKSGDYGVDLIVTKDGVKTAIQAKRFGPREHVDNTAIQKLDAGRRYYACDDALTVTNSRFTNNAIHAAKVLQVDLWDRNDLINALLKAKSITSGH